MDIIYTTDLAKIATHNQIDCMVDHVKIEIQSFAKATLDRKLPIQDFICGEVLTQNNQKVFYVINTHYPAEINLLLPNEFKDFVIALKAKRP